MNDTQHAINAAHAAHTAIVRYAKKHQIGADFGLHVKAIGVLVNNTAAQIDDTEQANGFVEFLTDSLSAGFIELPVAMTFTRTECCPHEPSAVPTNRPANFIKPRSSESQT